MDFTNMASAMLIQTHRELITQIAGAAGTPSMADSRNADLCEQEMLRRMAW